MSKRRKRSKSTEFKSHRTSKENRLKLSYTPITFMKNIKEKQKDLFDKFMKLDITICMPVNRDYVPITLFASYMNLVKPSHVLITDNTIPLDEARNGLVSTFLVKRPHSEYLLFWDYDCLPKPDALFRLWNNQEDICSGLYFQKGPPFYPLMSVRGRIPGGDEGFVYLLDWEPGKKYYVHGIGLGFVLIKRRVFEKIDYPWFRFDIFSEDYYFCEKVRKAGFKIAVDTGVVVKHLSNRLEVDDKFYRLYKERELSKIIDFNPGVVVDK